MSILPILVAVSVAVTLTFPFSALAQSGQQFSAASHYVPTPPPRFADPTLEAIAADEPVPPAGFPPLPDRLNLGTAIASADATGPRPPAPRPVGDFGRAPSPYHQGYGHVPAGAYMQPSQQPAPSGAPSSTGTQESFNTNSKTSAAQSAPRLPDLPAPVVVSQSTTQDLSLPDDEFSNHRPPKRRGMGGYAGGMLRGYMFGAAGMATGMGLGRLRY